MGSNESPAIVGRVKTWFAFGCTHIPHDDKENTRWIIEQIIERQPDVIVHLGDLFDTETVSDYPKVDVFALSAEYYMAAGFLDAINSAAPKAKKVFLEGNHEERIFRPAYAKLSSLLDYRKHVKPLKRWRIYPYSLHPDNTFKLGQLTCYHGFCATIGGSSERKESIDLGVPYGLAIHAHTHRPVFEHVSLNTWRIPYWRINVGCGIYFNWVQTNYAKKVNISQWGHAIAVGWVNTKRRHDGQRNWAAELIKRRGAWD